MNYEFDVIFIGSGHAAWHGAMALSKNGKKVAIVDGDLTGGTCTNYGCDAKILLDGPSEIAEHVKRYGTLAFENELKLNWEHLMEYKNKIIHPLPHMLKGHIEQAGIVMIDGFASFKDANTLIVNETEVTAETIVIATGQKNNRLQIPGNELLIDSRQFLSLPQLPKSIILIGGGVISLEFASLLSYYDIEITVVEYADSVLREFNQSHVQRLTEKLMHEGVQFVLGAAVQIVEQHNEMLTLSYNSGDVLHTLSAEMIVDATGRVANIERLNLEAVGIETDRGGIIVNRYMQTNMTNIFASGDVVSKQIPRLTPTATFESNYIASYLLGETRGAIEYPVVPMTVFTLPRLSRVGISEKEASEKPEMFSVIEVPYAQLLGFQMKNELDASLKLIVDKTRNLVGAEVIGSDAGEVINVLSMMIELKLTKAQRQQMLFAFPTQVGSIINVVNRFLG